MEVIDEEGDLFGVANVVDVLVVLFVLAVVVAGTAIVFGGGSESEGPTLATGNVTLDVGQQPASIAAAISEGDTHRAGANSRLTVTDVHLSPQGGRYRVVVRARLRAPASGDSLRYANAPPRLGRQLDVATPRYRVSGRIRAVGGDGSLAVRETRVVVRDTLVTADARAVAPGDEIRLGGRTVATVEDVAAYPTDDPSQRTVFVEATLRTYRQQDELRFGGTAVRRGQSVRLPGQGYTLDGRIERVGGGLDRGETSVLLSRTVDRETASRITAGDVVRVAGVETAEVASVRRYATADPARVRVFVGIDLRTVDLGSGPQFGTTPVRRGARIRLATTGYEVHAPIDRVGSVSQRGTPATRTVTLRASEVREEFADTLQPGMAERTDGQTVARLVAVDTEPTPIIATGDDGSVTVADHPYDRDVTLTAELRVRRTADGLLFKGRPIRQGTEVFLDLGTVTVRATVVSVA